MKLSRINTLALCLAASSLLGCSKSFLDTKIDSSQTIETLNSNYSTLISFANAPYNYLRNEFTMIDNNLFAPVSDEAVQTATGSSSVVLFNNGSYNSASNPDNYYSGYYTGIRAANYFLEQSVDYKRLLAVNRDTISAAAKINYNNDVLNMGWYRGEAHIMRAWYYFELSKRYGGVPLVTKALTINDDLNIPKAPYDSIINFIVNEVDTYKDSLQVNWKTSSFTNNEGRFSKGAALALKARALLYAASPLHNTGNDVTKWQKAAAAANDLIVFATATGGGGYALDANYGNYFIGSAMLTAANGSNETIWAIRYTASNTLETNNYPIATPGGKSGVTPSENLVADYEYKGTPDPTDPYKNRDPRLAASIVTNNSSWTGRTIDESPSGADNMSQVNASRTGYYLKKFLTNSLNLTQGGTAVHNWPVFRYGEMLLLYAEAMNEAYGPDNNNGYARTAREALNLVRNRTGVAMPAVTAAIAPDQLTFRDAVKHERRIELAFENYRYWDLLRWKDAEKVLNQPIKGVTVSKNGAAFVYGTTTVENRVFDASKMYYYPFPQSEIAKSKGTLIQNTGW